MRVRDDRIGFVVVCVFIVALGIGLLLQSMRLAKLSHRHETSTLELLETTRSHASAISRLTTRVATNAEVLEEVLEAQRELVREVQRLSSRMEELHLAQGNAVLVGTSDMALGKRVNDPNSPESLAHEAEVQALEASPYPFLLYDDLPESARQAYEQWQDCALFMEYPENRWGREKVGRVGYRLKDENGWRWVYLDDENGPRVQRLAELTYDIEALMTSNIERLWRSGAGLRFSSEQEAKAYVRGLALRSRHPTLRVDPHTGEAFVFSYDDVNAGVEEIRAQRELVGQELVGDQTGSYGASWVDVD